MTTAAILLAAGLALDAYSRGLFCFRRRARWWLVDRRSKCA